jgi:hypothetical protein
MIADCTIATDPCRELLSVAPLKDARKRSAGNSLQDNTKQPSQRTGTGTSGQFRSKWVGLNKAMPALLVSGQHSSMTLQPGPAGLPAGSVLENTRGVHVRLA